MPIPIPHSFIAATSHEAAIVNPEGHAVVVPVCVLFGVLFGVFVGLNKKRETKRGKQENKESQGNEKERTREREKVSNTHDAPG